MTAPDGPLGAIQDGDRSALARLLSVVEAGGADARAALRSLPVAHASATVGITGAPGVGKSTLTDGLVAALRESGESVAVLAIDPSSSLTGGALLGDRVRMRQHDTDPSVYIRSMASRGHLGGLARTTPQARRVLEAAGFGWILVETVGVGQAEIEVAGEADTTLVVVNPGGGDGVQAAKAGLFEVADVFVVNKADRDGADATAAELRVMVERTGRMGSNGEDPWAPPVIETIATLGRGIDDLTAAIAAHRHHLVVSGALESLRERRIRNEVRGLVMEELVARADDVCSGERFATVVRDVAAGLLDPYTAATDLTNGADGTANPRGEQ